MQTFIIIYYLNKGLGDFRIPSAMSAAPNGSYIPASQVYNQLGIVRDSNRCNYQSSWQAYECYGLNYTILVIERYS